ncbi:hypothetical protein M404DRAFT_542421 [Pisolithus tinctorius Marx 270]|uniref:Uncharacterized protein n=1 Tax=Pisolithus tinctorius Marx 270 TaxID=870435 RepID=A0A0C3MW80_PISTI|nr:hypothetical protein M404DRAFT_542421 [Pisolithus tinctorius Marx 270]
MVMYNFLRLLELLDKRDTRPALVTILADAVIDAMAFGVFLLWLVLVPWPQYSDSARCFNVSTSLWARYNDCVCKRKYSVHLSDIAPCPI